MNEDRLLEILQQVSTEDLDVDDAYDEIACQIEFSDELFEPACDK